MKKTALILIIPLLFLTGCDKKISKKEEITPTAQKTERSKEAPQVKEITNLPNELSNFIFETNGEIFKHCENTQGLSGYDFQFNRASVDLNSDGRLEYIIEPFQVCGIDIRGASWNGPYYVYGLIDNSWQEIGALEGNGYSILPDTNAGYYDIQTNLHDSATSGYTNLYRVEKSEGLPGFLFYKLIEKKFYSN